MATTHALTVVKNNCYKAPRFSNTDLPASMKEIEEKDSFSHNSEVSEESLDDLKRTKTRTYRTNRRHTNRSLNKCIQNYEKEDGVSEEQFYENLIKLREEHKKTLKLLETKYYNELKKQTNFQWEGFQHGVGLQEYNGTKNGASKDISQSGSKDTFHSNSSTQDFVKDLSHLNASAGKKYIHYVQSSYFPEAYSKVAISDFRRS